MRCSEFAGLGLILFAVTGRGEAAGLACSDLRTLELPHAEITATAEVAAGAFTLQGGTPAQQARQSALFKQVGAFCRVTVVSRPTRDSEIGIEVWLPATGWNGRVAAAGNGGFQSVIPFGAMADALIKGYAATGTNTGHSGNDERFAVGHPEKLVDWGHRAVHEMATTAKALVASRYGTKPQYSYFNSCSTGGRQAEVAAEYYPNDFDGIVAGNPANPMTRLQAGALWATAAVNKDEASFIAPEKWAMVHKRVVEQCDAVDGLADGIVDDPRRCTVDVNSMMCKSGDSPECLTGPQIEAVNKITAGLRHPRTGKQLYPGWLLGTPMLPSPVAAKTPDRSGTTTFRSLFQEMDWDYHTFDYDKDVARAEKFADRNMNAVDPKRLRKLFSRGGKLLIYHGWFDPNISALASVEYYDNAVAANGGTDKTFQSMRLFMIPGMYHCGGGEGPNTFDKLDVISAWVEKGEAPDQIVASHRTPQGEVDRTRPLCPYPRVARYKGSGSIDEAQNFACVASDRTEDGSKR